MANFASAFLADYFTGNGFTEAVYFTLKFGLDGAGFGEYILLIIVTIFFILGTTFFSYFYFKYIRRRFDTKSYFMKGILHHLVLFMAFLLHPLVLDIYSIYISMHQEQSTDFYKFYKKADVSVSQNKEYNLVYIYAESLEKTYFNENAFPELMPQLKGLKHTSTEFTNIQQVTATGWTIAGMTATQCGIPLFVSSWGNSLNGMDSFLSGTACLGDVLKSKGYQLSFMQGSSVEFSGIKKLYQTHKFDEVYGFNVLHEQLENKDYTNGWGLFDDSLFSIVYEKFEKLSQTNERFALFMATIDTHHPNGMLSKSCSNMLYKKGNNSILNTVHCSDKLISDFIKKIQKSKYADKTIIVLTSDHLAMRNTATDRLEKEKRRDLFLIFDPSKKSYQSIDKMGTMLDVGSTVLHTLGIETTIGLGKNLFSEISLISLWENFDKKLLSWKESILKFWQFAILGRYYEVDPVNQEINIGLHTYQIPLLAKVEKNERITPIFQRNSPKKLITYLEKFKPQQKFIWVDQCININYVFDLNLTGEQCIFQGDLSTLKKEFKILKDKTVTISTKGFLKEHKFNKEIFHKRKTRLKELMLCTKSLTLNQIAILSSRIPTLIDVPSAIATVNHFLPIVKKLNLLTIDSRGQYKLETFNTYQSKVELEAFFKRIETLIIKKKFWVMIAPAYTVNHDYLNGNTIPLKLGFKLLQKIDSSVSYVSYAYGDGKIYEFFDKDILCKVIDNSLLIK